MFVFFVALGGERRKVFCKGKACVLSPRCGLCFEHSRKVAVVTSPYQHKKKDNYVNMWSPNALKEL